MIPENAVVSWQKMAPWATVNMVEQDLVISRALINLYSDPIIARSLLFRGGTALNKLFLKPATRYSEDIDLVQKQSAPIGPIITAIRCALDPWLGSPKRKFTERCVKLIYRYQPLRPGSARLKIEINTTEHFHVLPLIQKKLQVASEWFEGEVAIPTYSLNELYCDQMGDSINRAKFEENLNLKAKHEDFLNDTYRLLSNSTSWHPKKALILVADQLVSQLAGDP